MKILIEGCQAVIKSGSTFEFNVENRLFMGRDSYTLNLTFPIRGCPSNQAIFGRVERKDVSKEKIFFDCEIIDSRMCASGSILITGVSDSEVKAQFVQGRCEQSAKDPFEKVYVNELDLGSCPNDGSFSPAEAWARSTEVALPWVNESYPDQFNNWVQYVDGGYEWAVNNTESRSGASTPHPPAVGTVVGSTSSMPAILLSWQPYLIMIAKRICDALDYTYDFGGWEESRYRYLIICNTLPYGWTRDYKDILPHWSVSEFFEKLELLMACEFDIDHRSKHISFAFSGTVVERAEPVCVDKVVDAYEVDIANDQEGCKYIGSKRLAYKECSHAMQPFFACDWFLAGQSAREYPDVNDLINRNKRHLLTDGDRQYPAYGEYAQIMPMRIGSMVWNDVNSVLYAIAEDTYFVMRSVGTEEIAGYRPGGYSQIYELTPVNVFGSGSVESEDVETQEIEFVPACVMDTDINDDNNMGKMLYLSCGSYEADTEYAESNDASEIRQPMTVSAIEAGVKEDKSSFYDVVYVGFWDGTIPEPGKSPYPIVDSVIVTKDWQYVNNHIADMRLSGRSRSLPVINPRQKFKFSFLSECIPNPRAIFHIHGKMYVCEKITATFTENGMSQLLKGDFYALAD